MGIGSKHRTHDNHERKSMGQRLAGLAMLVLALNIVAIVLIAVGLLVDWFSFSVADGDIPGQTHLRFTINTSEVSKDAEEAVEETRQVSEKMETAAEFTSADGTVVEKDEDAGELIVSENEGGRVGVTLTEVTEVEAEGGEATLSDIQIGDEVHLVYREKDGQNLAIKIQRQAPE